MAKMTVDVPLTAQELAEHRAAEIRRNEEALRKNTAAANRAAGKAEPKAGDKLYVATARGIKTRGRAGLVFSQTPAEVLVLGESDEAIAKKQLAGGYVVNPNGAEQILADSNGEATGLVLYTSKPGEAAAPTLETMSTDELEAELARRKATAGAMKGEERVGSSKKGDSK